MTEAEYRTLLGSDAIPLYDEDDPRCEEIDRPRNPAYGTVYEAINLVDAQRCLGDPSLDFRGGIRYSIETHDKFVYAYFWLRR